MASERKILNGRVFHDPANNIFGYKSNKTFARVHRDNNPFLFIMGPVASGKSSGCVWHCVENAKKQHPDHMGIRRAAYVIIRSTYPALKSTIVQTWIYYFRPFLKMTYSTPFIGELKMDLNDGTSLEIKLWFLACSCEEDVEKLKSLEVTGAHINEAKEIPKSIFTTAKTRINRYPSGVGGVVDPFVICDYNAVDTDHWLYRLAEEERPDRHSFYRQPPAIILQDGKYTVNPNADNIEHLGSTYYTDAAAGSDPDWINVFLMNNYGLVRSGRPVFKDYDDSTHVASSSMQPLHGVPLVIGMDQGLTPAAAFCQLSSTGQLLVFDEIVTQNTSLREFCTDHLKPMLHNKYKDWLDNYIVVIDPAAVQRSQNDARAGVDILRELGINYTLARTNALTSRLDSVIFFLRKVNGFMLSMNCPTIRKGFVSEYKFAEVHSRTVTGMFADKPVKNIYSHVMDALQYAALELNAPVVKRRLNKKSYRVASSIGGY